MSVETKLVNVCWDAGVEDDAEAQVSTLGDVFFLVAIETGSVSISPTAKASLAHKAKNNSPA